ncbi:MAG: FkbM family methyltransferase [Saprospiraceae bacterium]|jgi:FkbM family methyltransferase
MSIKARIIKFLEFTRFKRSYAQDGEDVVLSSFYDGKKRYKGFFVDVGAHHPVRFSNTWYFYKKGWKGINIDPTPGSMRSFKLLRSRDTNLELGVGQEESMMLFYCFNEPALNTFDGELAAQRNTGKPYKISKKITVPILPLSVILDRHLPAGQHIDFFTIDVEGLDLVVLKSNNWQKYRPDFLLVEDNHFNFEELKNSEMFQFLNSVGYEIKAVLQRTIIYRKKH